MAAVASFFVWVTSVAQGQAQGYVPESSFNAGNVHQGNVVEHAFVIRNPGRSALTLKALALSHPGMKIRMPQEIRAGQTDRILITWDTKLVQGDTTVEALVRLNDSENVFLTLSAKVIPLIEILPYPAVFMSGFRDESVTRVIEIVNNDSAPLNIVELSREHADSAESYAVTFRTTEPGRRHELNVELKTTAVGRFSDAILVRTDNARFPLIRIPVNLFVKDDVYINPESVDFGQITSEAWSPETFLLKSHRGPIKIVSVRSDLSFVKVVTPGAEAASTHELRVEIEGEPTPGPFKGSIYIRTDDAVFPEIKAPVQGEVVK
jgi:hypothetical protein